MSDPESMWTPSYPMSDDPDAGRERERAYRARLFADLEAKLQQARTNEAKYRAALERIAQEATKSKEGDPENYYRLNRVLAEVIVALGNDAVDVLAQGRRSVRKKPRLVRTWNFLHQEPVKIKNGSPGFLCPDCEGTHKLRGGLELCERCDDEGLVWPHILRRTIKTPTTPR